MILTVTGSIYYFSTVYVGIVRLDVRKNILEILRQIVIKYLDFTYIKLNPGLKILGFLFKEA